MSHTLNHTTNKNTSTNRIIQIGKVVYRQQQQQQQLQQQPQQSPYRAQNYLPSAVSAILESSLSYKSSSSPPLGWFHSHLQWMLQKELLQQDMLLIGSPGVGTIYRRQLVLAFAELINREIQVVSLSPDTTESDLKQRRELIKQLSQPLIPASRIDLLSSSSLSSSSSSSLQVTYMDQPPVSAAIHGRILLLDGLEKVERNVLPTLNNLLEHRTMNLEDGRLLCHPRSITNNNRNSKKDESYHPEQQQSSSSSFLFNQVPVHNDFRVIATAVPSPPWIGSIYSTIDPPLRSRFQIRRIDPPILVSSLSSTSSSLDHFHLDHLLEKEKEHPSQQQQHFFMDNPPKRIRDFSITTTNRMNEEQYQQQQQQQQVQQYYHTFVNAMNYSAISEPGKIVHYPSHLLLTKQQQYQSTVSQCHTSSLLPLQVLQDDWNTMETIALRYYPIAHSQLSKPFQEKYIRSKQVFRSAWEETIKMTMTTKNPENNKSNNNSDKKTSNKNNQPPIHTKKNNTIQQWITTEHHHHDNETNKSNMAMATIRTTYPYFLSMEPTLEQLMIPCGKLPFQNLLENKKCTVTDDVQIALTEILQEHAKGIDVLLLSPQGEGKNTIASHFANCLGYKTHLIHLYNDMTARDFFVRRSTDKISGETIWEDSPLLKAAQSGDICILDGIEKLRPHILSSALQSLCVDRDVFLPDGRRLLCPTRMMISNMEEIETTVHEQIIPIHPSFRIIALGSITLEATMGNTTFLEESIGMFASIVLPKPNHQTTQTILQSINPHCSKNDIDQLISLREILTDDVALSCGVTPLSTRNLIRIVRHWTPRSNLRESVLSIFVADLIPPMPRAILESILDRLGMKAQQTSKTQEKQKDEEGIVVEANSVTIGDFVMDRAPVKWPELIPTPNYFDIPTHVALIKKLLMEWKRGERAFLLLGNQGVGKNVTVDRLCEIARFGREYIQLHRDSTIGQILLQPTVEGGQITWKDSPLIRAVTHGLSLVVDEADKAPPEVLSVLKGLVEDGELLLGDGRRISRHNHTHGDEQIIKVHPDFTLWVLANRPGFPFLGNAFFKLIGDCFSTQVVQNPDLSSEIKLLQSFAPHTDKSIIRRLAVSFAELRSLSETNDIAYPYSTREAIAVVKHIEQFPDDTLVSALHNVLDFDSYDTDIYARLGAVFKRHGIPVDEHSSWKASTENGDLTLSIRYIRVENDAAASSNPPPFNTPKQGKWDDNNEAHFGGNQWAGGTGGSDTAGLGGRGGPYRLDRGHKVHQVSDYAKAQVSAESARVAQAMAKKALDEQLEKIAMSQTEWNAYKRFVDPIRADISTFRAFLNQLDLKQSDRGWIKQQTFGELDDSKLIDGVIGEKHVYKRRGVLENVGSLAQPQRLRFIVDCSASMYRFNGYDNRLVRCLEAATLIMESFDRMDQKFDYSITGHSGDSSSIPLVDFGENPRNEKHRMDVLQKIIAHSQYCQSGDKTLPAIEKAISASKMINDKAIVIALSDANLDRYGISPTELAQIMDHGWQNNIRSHVIFIASLGSEADEIRQSFPVGRAHVCLQSSRLAHLVKTILLSQLES